MGKFANKSEGVGTRMAPPPVVAPEDRNGFDALGYAVPEYRKEAGNRHLKDMGVTDAEKRWDCITSMSDSIKRDEPHDALEGALAYVDVTGAYRLLAVLLTALPSTPEPQPELEGKPLDWNAYD